MEKQKALVIDDKHLFIDVLSDLLGKRGFDVARALTLEEGAGLLGRERFEMIFLDSEMKNVEGTEGLCRVKSLGNGADIVVTASFDDTDRLPEFLKEGASDFLLKPYKGEELGIIIDKLLERKNIENDRDVLLHQNLEFIELLSLYRRLIRLVTIWELDKLKDNLFDEIMSTTYAQGAVLYMEAGNSGEFFAVDSSKGVVSPEILRRNIPRSTLDNPDMSFYLGPGEMNIPMRHDEKTPGFVKLVQPLLPEGFSEKEFNRAYLICEFISPAFENAKRLDASQQCAVRDDRRDASYWDMFRDFVKKEIYKAVRYERRLSVTGIRIENLAVLKQKYSADMVKAAQDELRDVLHNVIRDSDWLVEKSEDSYLAFLTETDYFGAVMAIRRIRQAMLGKCIIKGARSFDEFKLNYGAVGLPIHGTTLEELMKSMDERLDQSTGSLYYQLDFNKRSYDQLCEDILGFNGDGFDRKQKIYHWGRHEKNYFNELLVLFMNEIKLNTRRRGIIYAGFFDGANLGFIEDKEGFVDLATKVYFFLSQNKDHFDFPGIVTVGVEHMSYEEIKFVIYLNEHYSYVYLESGNGVFESSDALLIEAMISKLQTEYYLQWQL